jgi:hypothetical protein
MEIWKGFVKLLNFLVLVIIPLAMVYSFNTELRIILAVAAFFFFLDIFLNFMTSFYQKGFEVTSHRKIALNYF